MANNFNNNIEALLGKLENFVTTKTVVGEAIHLDGVILLPLIEVAFGAGAGVGNTNTKEDESKESGGGGIGGRITPSAVIVINNGNVQLVNVKNQDSLNKLIDLFPSLLAKFNLGNKASD